MSVDSTGTLRAGLNLGTLAVPDVTSAWSALLTAGDAVLIEWTKGVRIRDVVGKPVGALLRAALERRGKSVRAIPVLNDTVASLLAGAALAPELVNQYKLTVVSI